MLKKILRKLLKLLLIPLAILDLIAYSCRDDVIEYHISKIPTEMYFEGTGHSDEVVIDTAPPYDYQNIENSGKLKLDNFTKDAYDIRVHSHPILHKDPYWVAVHYWLTFSFETFSTYCKEDNESNIMLPYILNSPEWW
ncbi:MAG: hypothetical protein L7F77_10830, partial [Candidatus Magnetominusculus sp. LBB02]|nr:hypothetical protein [Candidatus Magnetominusculus sp. LBB02]